MTTSTVVSKITRFPTHVAIVPDGNGRWAEQRGLPRLAGHQAGAENMWRMITYLHEYPIKYLTLYGFSTENWSRPEAEVSGLLHLLADHIRKEINQIHRRGMRLKHIGRREQLPHWLLTTIDEAVELTRNNTGMILSLAFNYGGRAEIVDAVRRILIEGIPPEKVNEKLFVDYLYTAGLPDVDLVIRTADELRLSNFLIWQSAYSEYYFTKVLWPDIRRRDMNKALLAYSQRQRRFGGL